VLIGEGRSSIGYIGLTSIAEAHRRWRLADSRMLGIDRLEVYQREQGAS
jgi:diaminohydroxyphosphoribosylaminopyrimidine deaminase/5-amino-6-(5-phosphoribosylamino)uracil reductase